jgi:hypothetical protein
MLKTSPVVIALEAAAKSFLAVVANSLLYRWELLTAVCVLLPLVTTYVVTLIASWWVMRRARDGEKEAKKPPTLPYVIPFLGHLVRYMRDGQKTTMDGV